MPATVQSWQKRREQLENSAVALRGGGSAGDFVLTGCIYVGHSLHVTGKKTQGSTMASSVNTRVAKRRNALREAGLRPVQIWVPDTRRLGFAEQCRIQASRVAHSDVSDAVVSEFLDRAAHELDDWR